ncbi:Hypothetical predicted protein [Lecanosticta acicola]|uniref:F-box domain-containing protein n=1 Tax=Lecanosticta acicola TaxID=111012 RepID=A0AAI8Z654_9PEZI|nr:Hypothetical predicted protein [Lecanosticta acicola]
MYFDALPNEILTHVYLSLPNIASAIALSATSHRLYSVYHSSKKLVILQDAADAEVGPVDDIVQLLTQNASQPAHIRRRVLMSEALLHQVVKVGRVAQQYEEIYPLKKWKTDYANRRLLTTEERYNLRRAIYRLWLYDKAFHNSAHVRTCRGLPEIVRERAALLHNFSTSELAEMMDVHIVLRDMVANNVCPSNGKIRQKFQKRFPESKHQLPFNIHLNYPPTPSTFVPDSWYHNSSFGSARYQSRLAPSRWHEPGAEGWGDDISHYYVIEDMMKLDPEQLLYLRDQCPLKAQVEAHVRGLGDWFSNNGETFSETLGYVIRQRNRDLEELKMAIEDYEVGVAVVDD